MGFGWSGAGAGASDALAEMLTQRRAAFLQQQDLKLRRDAAQRAHDQQTADNADRAWQRKLQTAQIAVSQVRPGDELSPDVAAQIQGTPYASRLKTQDTLPATGIGMPSGGRQFTTLTPTLEQEQAQGQQTAKRTFIDLVKRGAPRNQIISAMADAGGTVPESAFDDPNLGHTQRMQEIAAQGEQSRRTALTTAGAARAAAPIGPRDRVSARRQADAAASDYLDSLARASGGFLPANVDPDAIRAQFVEAYMADLDPAAGSQANTDRALTNVRQVMPRPYGSRQPVNARPIVGLQPRTAQTDPYEAYLARQRGTQ